MEETAKMPDWDGLRIFLALCRARSLAAAARKLDVDETTVARRLARLEKDMGASLLERTPGGLTLSAAGEAVRAAAEEMESHALTAERRALGADRQLSGRVRVTAPEILGKYFVLPALQAVHRRHPARGRRRDPYRAAHRACPGGTQARPDGHDALRSSRAEEAGAARRSELCRWRQVATAQRRGSHPKRPRRSSDQQHRNRPRGGATRPGRGRPALLPRRCHSWFRAGLPRRDARLARRLAHCPRRRTAHFSRARPGR